MTEVIFFTPGYTDKHLRQLPVCSDMINKQTRSWVYSDKKMSGFVSFKFSRKDF